MKNKHNNQVHNFHLVDQSPRSLIIAIGVLKLTSGGVL